MTAGRVQKPVWVCLAPADGEGFRPTLRLTQDGWQPADPAVADITGPVQPTPALALAWCHSSDAKKQVTRWEKGLI